MALVELLAQYGVDVADQAAVFALLKRLPIARRSKVVLWHEYAQSRGFVVSDGQRAALLSELAGPVSPPA